MSKVPTIWASSPGCWPQWQLGYGVRQAVARQEIAPQEANHEPQQHLRPWIIWFCVALALISLLFAFGTPLYALLYYGLPGWNQLHSPFRWVFPFTLSMAMLAAVGLHLLPSAATLWSRRFVRLVAGIALMAALAAVGVVVVQSDAARAIPRCGRVVAGKL